MDSVPYSATECWWYSSLVAGTLNRMRLPTLIALAGLLSIVALVRPQSDRPSSKVAPVLPSQQGAGPDHHNQNTLPRSVVFFSPNTTDTLSDADAMAGLKSFAEANAIAVADRAACALGNVAEVDPGIGIFDTSAENSVLLEGAWDSATAGYLAVLLARYEHQEWAFWFTAAPTGKERLWLVASVASPAEIARQIRAAGLSPVTEILSPQGNVVFIIASETAAARVAKLAAALHATVTSEPGSSARMGSDGSSGPEGVRAAIPLYDAAIARFEQARHVALSNKLWTPEWRDATDCTCTVGK